MSWIIPSQMGNMISESLVSFLVRWNFQKHITRETTRRRPNQMTRFPNHLGQPLLTPTSSCSTLSSSRMYELLTLSKAESNPAVRETHFGQLYFRSCTFSHYQQLVTKCEVWIINCLMNRELSSLTYLSLQHNWPISFYMPGMWGFKFLLQVIRLH